MPYNTKRAKRGRRKGLANRGKLRIGFGYHEPKPGNKYGRRRAALTRKGPAPRTWFK